MDEYPEASVDATGLESHHVSRHFLARIRGRTKRYRRYPKLTAVIHHHSHLIVSALARQGPGNDAPDFAPVVSQAAQNMSIDRLFADAGYDSESHHRLARELLGIRSTIIPVNRRRSQAQQARPTGRYRRWMHARFPAKLYRRRWHIESAFSQHKRRLGSALRSRSAPSRTTESLLRVITHDLMILRCQWKGFYRAISDFKSRHPIRAPT
ncbi:MAG TPA: transposase [Phycisphaerae bacterium]|nr:transposase [Phycisphaerae bacterium]